MKLHLPKQLFTALLTAFTLAAAPSAWGADMTFTGVNNRGIDTSSTTAQDTVTFQMTDTTDKSVSQNYFAGSDTRTTHANIVISDNEETDGMEGLVITDGNGSNKQIYTGAVTGNGIIRKQGPSNGNAITFEGNVTEFTGDIHIATAADFTLTFGGHTEAVDASVTSAGAGIAGTGSISINSNGTTLNFNYTASSNPVYITNAISESGNYSSIINLKGGADYIFTKTAYVDKFSIDTNTSVKLTQGSYTFGSAGAVSGGGLLILGDGVTAEITAKQGIQTHVEVNGGGTLKSSVVDGTWYQAASATKSITLAGTSSEKMATFDVTARQTYVTPTYMNGNAQITSSNAGGSLQLYSGATFTVTGTNNIISAAMTTSRASLFDVAEGGTLEISGQVTRNSDASNDTITKKGAGELIFAHADNTIQGGLIIENGTVTIASGGKINIYNTISNAGTLNIEGILNISNVSAFEGAGEITGYSSSSSTVSSSENGYGVGKEILIAGGKVTTGANYTVTGINAYRLEEGVGLVGLLENDRVVSNKVFYANVGTVKLGDGAYTDYDAASTFVVKSGATLDINGKILANETAELEGDAKLTNTGAEVGEGMAQLKTLTLKGDATVEAGNAFGLLSSNWGETIMNLNGHTLTKEGDARFFLVQTTVNNGGTINAREGAIQIGSTNSRDEVTTANNVVFSTEANGTLSLVNGGKLIAKGVEGAAGAINGASNTTLQLESADNHSYLGTVTGGFKLVKKGSGTQTFGGNTVLGTVTLEGGKLAIGGTSSVTGVISGAGSLEKIGTGTLTLSSANTYTGATTITDGILSLNLGQVDGVNRNYTLANSVSGSGTLQVESGTTLLNNDKLISSNIILNGGHLTINGDKKLSANVTMENGSYLSFSNGDALDYDKSAAINMEVKTGAVLDFGGTRQAFTTNSVLTLAGGRVTGTGDDFGAIDMKDSANFTIKATENSSLDATVRLRDGATIIVDVADDKTLDASGVFKNRNNTSAGGSFTKKGTGELVLSAANTYTGGTKIEAGTVTTRNASALGTGGVNMTGGVLSLEEDLNLGGKLEIAGEASARIATSGKSLNLGTAGSVKKSAAGTASVTVSSNGANAAMAAKSDNVELIQLMQDASFTIQDMTLTDVKVEAGSEVKVYLDNVEAVNTVLTGGGQFALNAAPTVGTAATAENKGTLSFNTGLSVEAGTTLTLNLDVLNAVGGDEHGTYDLTITLTLTGFDAEFDFSSITDQVVIDAGSWLGYELSGVIPVVTNSALNEGASAVENSAGAPTLTYTTTAASGGNVGTLVITIGGLNVPEPTTATLSLLALAALAARRRRK